MTLGGVQILLKSQGVVPEGRILVAGTGPLLYLTASQLLENGANVIGVLDASSLPQLIKKSIPLWRSLDLLTKGIYYFAGLKKHRIPIYFRSVVKEALGSEYLEEVVSIKINEDWVPIPGTEKKLEADALCLNFGFVPSTSFTHLAKCEHTCNPYLRGWAPIFNSRYETSQEGIFVAGDCTGIGGVKMAVLEGKIVGTEVAYQLGCIAGAEADKRQTKLRKALLKLLTDDTVVCRCEEVMWKTISRILNDGYCHIEQIKRLTRMGMGRCQGRFCYPTLLGILGQQLSAEELAKEDFSGRLPVKPFPLKLFSEIESMHQQIDNSLSK
jgi:NADPH-dependent 2,4-dienoyl-CoA reductase/sulfur reductase-like enzyme